MESIIIIGSLILFIGAIVVYIICTRSQIKEIEEMRKAYEMYRELDEVVLKKLVELRKGS